VSAPTISTLLIGVVAAEDRRELLAASLLFRQALVDHISVRADVLSDDRMNTFSSAASCGQQGTNLVKGRPSVLALRRHHLLHRLDLLVLIAAVLVVRPWVDLRFDSWRSGS
jgi:hypothetical protein